MAGHCGGHSGPSDGGPNSRCRGPDGEAWWKSSLARYDGDAMIQRAATVTATRRRPRRSATPAGPRSLRSLGALAVGPALDPATFGRYSGQADVRWHVGPPP
jgi:hypothetical protein